MVGNQLVHRLACTFAPDEDAIDWWGYLDMSEYAGETAKLYVEGPEEIAKMIKFGDELPNLQPLYDEGARSAVPPQPETRLEQRSERDGSTTMASTICLGSATRRESMGECTGGIAVSPDMIHWTELPTRYGRWRQHPGPALLDGGPQLSFRQRQRGPEEHGRLADRRREGHGCGFTDTGAARRWPSARRSRPHVEDAIPEGNPVIQHQGRDRKLLWNQYDSEETPAQRAGEGLLGGHWVILSRLRRGRTTRPELRVLHVDRPEEVDRTKPPARLLRMPGTGRIAGDGRPTTLAGSSSLPMPNMPSVGFDGRTFTPEHEGKHRVHYGAYFASQIFNNAPDGRRIQIAWARLNLPDMPFSQAFTFPHSLTLRKTPEGIRMFAKPD